MKILLLALGITLTGCVTEKTIVSSSYRFKDGVAYKEQKFYILPAQNENDRWEYAVSKNAPDKGIAKEMILCPHTVDIEEEITDEDMERYSEEYHQLHPECTYHYSR